MADEQFTVQMDEQDYRICGPEGEEGPMVPYGMMATLQIDQAIFYCLIEDGNDENPVVYRVDRVSKMATDTEEVEFPKEIVAAQRKLDEVLESEAAVLDATIVDSGPEVN